MSPDLLGRGRTSARAGCAGLPGGCAVDAELVVLAKRGDRPAYPLRETRVALDRRENDRVQLLKRVAGWFDTSHFESGCALTAASALFFDVRITFSMILGSGGTADVRPRRS